MKWLRDRPNRAEELDMVDYRGRWIDSGRAAGDVGDESFLGEGDRKKGTLFDDEDEEAEDDEEEEEEEDVVKGEPKPVQQSIPAATSAPRKKR